MKIIKIALPVPLRQSYDYLPKGDISKLQPGVRVKVPFGSRQLIGLFLGIADKSDVPTQKLKSITYVIDDEPILSPQILKLCQWAANYYHYPLGEVLFAALPKLIRQGDLPEIKTSPYLSSQPQTAFLHLNAEQQQIVRAIQKAHNHFSVVVIAGVTGSGKTEIYLHAIAELLAQNKSVLLLIPEINLTPQTLARFAQRFTYPIITLHSGLSDKMRYLAWSAAAQDKPKIVIGTRSAVFTGIPNLGLIVVDEEHDSSFKQQDTFRYNARDLAVWRAHDSNIPIILGSATPSLETLHQCLKNKYQYFELSQRATKANMPDFQIIDLKGLILDEGLSPPLLQAMDTHLQAGNQVLLFLNRRGYAPILLCHDCGWMATCTHCDARLTYHLRPKHLHCHHCEAQRPVPNNCEQCGAKELTTVGLGTQRLETTLQKHFPNYAIARIDRDSTRRKGTMEEKLNSILSGNSRILIGTQMLAKGHHFPQVTLVGIIDSDYGLFSTDYRASEKLGQLIVQVAGRAGREDRPGVVMLQTHYPEHPLVELLKQGNYQSFANALLQERKQAQLPPYAAFALLHAEAHCVDNIENFLQQVKAQVNKLDDQVTQDISLQGPVAAILAKKAGRHRMQLLVQATQRKRLQNFLTALVRRIEELPNKHRIHWAVDVDPVEF